MISTGFVTSSMANFGYFGVFVLMVLESASLPIPSEVVLPFAGYLVFRGSLNFVNVVLVSSAASLIGSMVDYYLASKLGRPIVEGLFRWSGLRLERLDRAEKWLGAKGSWTILVARFVPGLRSAISLPAGALRMGLRTFVSMTTIGSFGWSVMLIYLGYSAGNLWQTALARLSPLFAEIGVLTAVLTSVFYIVYYVSRAFRDRRQSPR
jgi:membrane protein DedA with SNARE-associated domain